jgi:hypothetical protein
MTLLTPGNYLCSSPTALDYSSYMPPILESPRLRAVKSPRAAVLTTPAPAEVHETEEAEGWERARADSTVVLHQNPSPAWGN